MNLGDGSLWTYLDSLVKGREMVLLCMNLDSQLWYEMEMVLLFTYLPTHLFSASGQMLLVSTHLDSLLIDDREIVLSVRTWTLC